MTGQLANSMWDSEYDAKGIPSSYRDEPSGVIVWTLANAAFFTSDSRFCSILDAGCGTGRNAIHMAKATGAKVTAVDFSPTAIDLARKRHDAADIDFQVRDVTAGLPWDARSFDLVTDVFVYFHILSDSDRAKYRQELSRVCKSGAHLLVSMATAEDGYYRKCPDLEAMSEIAVKFDPQIGVGNILPTVDELLSEFSDLFDVEMAWHKHKRGKMHGEWYERYTTALILAPRPV